MTDSQTLHLLNQAKKKRQPEGWRFSCDAYRLLRLATTEARALARTGRCTTAFARWRVLVDQDDAWTLLRRCLGRALGVGRTVCHWRTATRITTSLTTRSTAIATTTAWRTAAFAALGATIGRTWRAWTALAVSTRCSWLAGWTLAFDMRFAGITRRSSGLVTDGWTQRTHALGLAPVSYTHLTLPTTPYV